jgi:hypothetical protein
MVWRRDAHMPVDTGYSPIPGGNGGCVPEPWPVASRDSDSDSYLGGMPETSVRISGGRGIRTHEDASTP